MTNRHVKAIGFVVLDALDFVFRNPMRYVQSIKEMKNPRIVNSAFDACVDFSATLSRHIAILSIAMIYYSTACFVSALFLGILINAFIFAIILFSIIIIPAIIKEIVEYYRNTLDKV